MHRYYTGLQSKLWWFSFHQAGWVSCLHSAFSLPRFVNCLTSVHKQSATIKCFYISACQIRGQKAGRIVCGIRGETVSYFTTYNKVYKTQRVLQIWWVSKNLRRCAPPLPFTLGSYYDHHLVKEHENVTCNSRYQRSDGPVLAQPPGPDCLLSHRPRTRQEALPQRRRVLRWTRIAGTPILRLSSAGRPARSHQSKDLLYMIHDCSTDIQKYQLDSL